MGIFVFCAIIIIAGMVSEMSTIVLERAEQRLESAIENASKSFVSHDPASGCGGASKQVHQEGISLQPLCISLTVFVFFAGIGVAFFHLYPGEGKTLGQAVYMSVITLTTVGFGAFTATTTAGKVFSAFWMILGVGALGSVVVTSTELIMKLKEDNTDETKQQAEAAESMLHSEYVDHGGQVDKTGYLIYALLKYGICKKVQIELLMKQFKALDTEGKGTVSVELVAKLSENAPLTPGETPLGSAHHDHDIPFDPHMAGRIRHEHHQA